MKDEFDWKNGCYQQKEKPDVPIIVVVFFWLFFIILPLIFLLPLVM